MAKKNAVEIKKDKKKALKMKIEKAKDGFDVKIGDMKLDADGVASVKGNKNARTYYFKNKKHNTRAYVVITGDSKEKGFSLNFKKVMEAVERSTQDNMFQQFLNRVVSTLSVQDFSPVAIVIRINDLGFTVGVNGYCMHSCYKLFWSDKEKDADIIAKIREDNKPVSKLKSDTEIMAEGYKESIDG